MTDHPLTPEAVRVLEHLAGLGSDAAGLSNQALGEALGFNRGTISRIRRGLADRGLADPDSGAVTAAGRRELQALAAAEMVRAGLMKPAGPTANPGADEDAARTPFAAGPDDAGGGGSGDLTELPFDRLAESPLNPRKTFDDATIGELADSIAAQGVLQNLVVRPHPDAAPGRPGKFEIVAGARRYRAVARLIAEGRAEADFLLPVRIAHVDDLEFLFLSTLENLQRDDMPPLEEAEAFARMVAAGADTATIAERIGKTRRHVQLRLALAEKLAESAREALRDGTINLATARILATAPAKCQAEVMEEIARGWHRTAESVQAAVARDLPPVDIAIFDLDAYDGEIIEDEDGDRVFADQAQFERLQRAAIDDTVADLRKKWPWVDIVELRGRLGGWFRDYTIADNRHAAEIGAVVLVDSETLAVEIHKSLQRRAELREPAAAAGGESEGTDDAPAPPAGPTKALCAFARQRKTETLQKALADVPGAAMILVILALRQSSWDISRNPVRLVGDTPAGDDGKAMAAAKERALQALAKATSESRNPARQFKDLWQGSAVTLDGVFAAAVAPWVGTWAGYDPELGDDPLIAAVAETLSLDSARNDGPGRGEISEDFLKLCRKPRLIEIAFASGAFGAGGIDNIADAERRTKTQLIKDILVSPWRDRSYVPPELRFGAWPAIEKALAEERDKALTHRGASLTAAAG